MTKRIFIFVLLLGMIGCASTNSSNTSNTTLQNIPPDSKFAKVTVGMGETQVRDLIGFSTDYSLKRTGKEWIPFYLGDDIVRSVHHYKAEGRLIFNKKGRLVEIEYDPSEDGYK